LNGELAKGKDAWFPDMPVESLERKRRRVISNIEISGCSAERDIGV
jgi:hypothetical protein